MRQICFNTFTNKCAVMAFKLFFLLPANIFQVLLIWTKSTDCIPTHTQGAANSRMHNLMAPNIGTRQWFNTNGRSESPQIQLFESNRPPNIADILKDKTHNSGARKALYTTWSSKDSYPNSEVGSSLSSPAFHRSKSNKNRSNIRNGVFKTWSSSHPTLETNGKTVSSSKSGSQFPSGQHAPMAGTSLFRSWSTNGPDSETVNNVLFSGNINKTTDPVIQKMFQGFPTTNNDSDGGRTLFRTLSSGHPLHNVNPYSISSPVFYKVNTHNKVSEAGQEQIPSRSSSASHTDRNMEHSHFTNVFPRFEHQHHSNKGSKPSFRFWPTSNKTSNDSTGIATLQPFPYSSKAAIRPSNNSELETFQTMFERLMSPSTLPNSSDHFINIPESIRKRIEARRRHPRRNNNSRKDRGNDVDRIFKKLPLPDFNRKHLKFSSLEIQDKLKQVVSDWIANSSTTAKQNKTKLDRERDKEDSTRAKNTNNSAHNLEMPANTGKVSKLATNVTTKPLIDTFRKPREQNKNKIIDDQSLAQMENKGSQISLSSEENAALENNINNLTKSKPADLQASKKVYTTISKNSQNVSKPNESRNPNENRPIINVNYSFNNRKVNDTNAVTVPKETTHTAEVRIIHTSNHFFESLRTTTATPLESAAREQVIIKKHYENNLAEGLPPSLLEKDNIKINVNVSIPSQETILNAMITADITNTKLGKSPKGKDRTIRKHTSPITGAKQSSKKGKSKNKTKDKESNQNMSHRMTESSQNKRNKGNQSKFPTVTKVTTGNKGTVIYTKEQNMDLAVEMSITTQPPNAELGTTEVSTIPPQNENQKNKKVYNSSSNDEGQLNTLSGQNTVHNRQKSKTYITSTMHTVSVTELITAPEGNKNIKPLNSNTSARSIDVPENITKLLPEKVHGTEQNEENATVSTIVNDMYQNTTESMPVSADIQSYNNSISKSVTNVSSSAEAEFVVTEKSIPKVTGRFLELISSTETPLSKNNGASTETFSDSLRKTSFTNNKNVTTLQKYTETTEAATMIHSEVTYKSRPRDATLLHKNIVTTDASITTVKITPYTREASLDNADKFRKHSKQSGRQRGSKLKLVPEELLAKANLTDSKISMGNTNDLTKSKLRRHFENLTSQYPETSTETTLISRRYSEPAPKSTSTSASIVRYTINPKVETTMQKEFDKTNLTNKDTMISTNKESSLLSQFENKENVSRINSDIGKMVPVANDTFESFNTITSLRNKIENGTSKPRNISPEIMDVTNVNTSKKILKQHLDHLPAISKKVNISDHEEKELNAVSTKHNYKTNTSPTSKVTERTAYTDVTTIPFVISSNQRLSQTGMKLTEGIYPNESFEQTTISASNIVQTGYKEKGKKKRKYGVTTERMETYKPNDLLPPPPIFVRTSTSSPRPTEAVAQSIFKEPKQSQRIFKNVAEDKTFKTASPEPVQNTHELGPIYSLEHIKILSKQNGDISKLDNVASLSNKFSKTSQIKGKPQRNIIGKYLPNRVLKGETSKQVVSVKPEFEERKLHFQRNLPSDQHKNRATLSKIENNEVNPNEYKIHNMGSPSDNKRQIINIYPTPIPKASSAKLLEKLLTQNKGNSFQLFSLPKSRKRIERPKITDNFENSNSQTTELLRPSSKQTRDQLNRNSVPLSILEMVHYGRPGIKVKKDLEPRLPKLGNIEVPKRKSVSLAPRREVINRIPKMRLPNTPKHNEISKPKRKVLFPVTAPNTLELKHHKARSLEKDPKSIESPRKSSTGLKMPSYQVGNIKKETRNGINILNSLLSGIMKRENKVQLFHISPHENDQTYSNMPLKRESLPRNKIIPLSKTLNSRGKTGINTKLAATKTNYFNGDRTAYQIQNGHNNKKVLTRQTGQSSPKLQGKPNPTVTNRHVNTEKSVNKFNTMSRQRLFPDNLILHTQTFDNTASKDHGMLSKGGRRIRNSRTNADNTNMFKPFLPDNGQANGKSPKYNYIPREQSAFKVRENVKYVSENGPNDVLSKTDTNQHRLKKTPKAKVISLWNSMARPPLQESSGYFGTYHNSYVMDTSDSSLSDVKIKSEDRTLTNLPKTDFTRTQLFPFSFT